ncbi:uncharacterized protein ATNIH1004_008006 [Aspergillus tanneri]|uniref:Serine hydrolase domain-containing protein n=1 Tax=Aspergillus tanneri TaxID=1220188 RepID=A0A5M9MNQ8_9EURO|nr:uncharacterized protein ATNIH1004_008006 [Aspergillus tanneri]KAA8646573.1 hypothetical protein ATNIH1004_008006 [Aspergillus tanneri]
MKVVMSATIRHSQVRVQINVTLRTGQENFVIQHPNSKHICKAQSSNTSRPLSRLINVDTSNLARQDDSPPPRVLTNLTTAAKMRVLCLHGGGINSRIFKTQTAEIRYELGDDITYDFVEGTIPSEMYPGVEIIAAASEQTFAYVDDKDPSTWLSIHQSLSQHLQTDGPYDGVIAFSQAATLILSYIIHITKERNSGKPVHVPFRFAVFFSIVLPPVDYTTLQEKRVVEMEADAARDLVDIPTAHIWGVKDPGAKGAEEASRFCSPNTRWVYVHGGGHEIPGSGTKKAVVRTTHMIRRAIESCGS